MNGRSFGFLDHFALWTSLGAGLYLMPFGSLLVPAASIEMALLATVIAALLGGLLVASIAAIAANTGRSTAELLAEPFGGRARRPVAVILVGRHLLFAVFALALIADSAALISDHALGVGMRPVWVALFGLAGAALALAGPERLSTGLRRAGVWLVLLVALAVSASAYLEFEIPSYLKRPSVGGWPSFWQAVDLMMIFPLLWLPVVADFARFGRDQRAAGGGTFAGVFLASVWFGTLGILYLPATSSGDIPGFLVGMQLGLGALALLFVLQIDEVFVNAGAAGPAADALGAAGARYAPAVLLVAALPAAALLNVAELEWYVLLAASAFVPAFAIVCGRALWPAARHWTVPAIAWAAGFVLYQWISPAEIGWWQDACSAPFEALGLAFPLSEEVTWLGAAVPAFLLALCLDTLVPAALRLFSGRLSARPAVS